MKANNLTQELAVATRLTPAAARAAGSYVTPAILASKFERLVALLQIGTLSGSATVLAKFQHNCVTSTFASTSWLGGCEVLGMPRHKPATEHDSADVVQTVVY